MSHKTSAVWLSHHNVTSNKRSLTRSSQFHIKQVQSDSVITISHQTSAVWLSHHNVTSNKRSLTRSSQCHIKQAQSDSVITMSHQTSAVWLSHHNVTSNKCILTQSSQFHIKQAQSDSIITMSHQTSAVWLGHHNVTSNERSVTRSSQCHIKQAQSDSVITMSHQTSAQLDVRGSVFRFLEGARYLSLTQPTIYGQWGGLLTGGGGGEWLGLEVDYPCLPSAEVKNEWSYTPTPLYAFMACTLYHSHHSDLRLRRPNESQCLLLRLSSPGMWRHVTG